MPGVFVPAVKTALVELIGQLFSNEVVNTLFVQFAVAITNAMLDELCDTAKGFFTGGPLAYVSHNYHLDQVRATDLTTQTGASILKVYTPTPGPINDGTGLPGNAALAIKFATDKRGRSYRGRNYLAGLASTQLLSGDANEISSTAVANLVTQYSALPGLLLAMTVPGVHVVCSRHSLGAPRVSAVLTPVSAYEVNSAMDSQRRRLDFRGA